MLAAYCSYAAVGNRLRQVSSSRRQGWSHVCRELARAHGFCGLCLGVHSTSPATTAGVGSITQFEFLFALFGLLLGLSLTAVLGGLARTIEARLRPRAAMRVGWLTPLLAASLAFPRDLGGEATLDDHFFRIRRVVVGVLLVLLCCQIAWYASVPALAARLTQPQPLVLAIILVALMIAAMIVRGERWCRVVMIALVARYLVGYLL